MGPSDSGLTNQSAFLVFNAELPLCTRRSFMIALHVSGMILPKAWGEIALETSSLPEASHLQDGVG